MRDRSFGNNPDLIHQKKTRAEFEKLKLTQEFKDWKLWQYNMQRGNCAWCERGMRKTFKGTHVDHALPIYYGGTNKYENLVIAHAMCNIRKWIRIDATPQWIVNNQTKWKEKQELKDRYQQIVELTALQQKQYEELQELNYQDNLARKFQWINI